MDNHLKKLEDLRGEGIIDLLRGLCRIFAGKYSSEAPAGDEDIQHSLFQKALNILLFEDPEASETAESPEDLLSYMRGTLFNNRHKYDNIDDLINQLEKHTERLESWGSHVPVSRFLLYLSWRTKGNAAISDTETLGSTSFPSISSFKCRPFTRTLTSAAASASPTSSPTPTRPSSPLSTPSLLFQDICLGPSDLMAQDSKSDFDLPTGCESCIFETTTEGAVCPDQCVTLQNLMNCIKSLMTGKESECFRKSPNGFELIRHIHTEEIRHMTLVNSCETFCLAGDAFEYLDKVVNDRAVEELFESSLSKYLLNYSVSVTSAATDTTYLSFFLVMDGLSQQIRDVVKFISETSGTQLLSKIFRGALVSNRFSRGVLQLFLLEYCNSYFNLVDAWIFRGVCYPQFFVEQTIPDDDIVDRSTFLKAFVLKAQDIPFFLPRDQILECGRNVFLLRLIGNDEFSSLLQVYKDKPKLQVTIDDDEVSELSKRWERFLEHYKCRFQPIFKEEKFDFDPKGAEAMREESSRRIKLEKETENKAENAGKVRMRQLRYEDMKRWNKVITAQAIEDSLVELRAEVDEKIKLVQEDEEKLKQEQEVVQEYSKEMKAVHKQHVRNVWKLKRDSSDSINVPYIGEKFSESQLSGTSSVAIHSVIKKNLQGARAKCKRKYTKALENLEPLENSVRNLNLGSSAVVSLEECSAGVNPEETSQPIHSSHDTPDIQNSPEDASPKKNVFERWPRNEPSASTSGCKPASASHSSSASTSSIISSQPMFEPKSGQVTSPSTLVISLFSSVTRPLEIHSDYIQWVLTKFFIQDMQIYKDFKIIKDYMFLGLFGDMFTDSACRLVESNTHPVIFMKAARAILEKTSCPRLSCIYEEPESSILDLSKFKLTYLTSWPLNIILTEECVKKYTAIFDICWLLNRATWYLDDCRRKFAMPPSMKGNQLLQVNIHIHIMRIFVCALKNYLSFVFENASTKFIKELATVRTLDRLYQVHVDYLKQILFNALLDQNITNLFKEINDAVQTTLRYSRIARLESEWRAGGDFGNSKFRQLKKLYVQFREILDFIQQFVSKVAERAEYVQLCLLRELICPLN